MVGGNEGLMDSLVDTGLSCLVLLARFHDVSASAEELRHEFADGNKNFGKAELLLAARSLGLKARFIESEFDRLDKIALPAIAQYRGGGFFVIARIQQDHILIHEPTSQRQEVVSRTWLDEMWGGGLMLIQADASFLGELSRFDFTWFVPAIIKYRRLLGEVLLLSFALQCFALLTPLFFQVVMDKVLVHRGLTTLDIISIGLLGVVFFESVLSGVRAYVFTHTTSRIDVELGARLFRHLLSLPLSYFQARRTGDSVARVRELEGIRSFLTGSGITVVLDVLFSVVFLVVMLMYSGWLTLVVVLSLPLYFVISILVTPILRRRLNESFNRGAENQSFLVEVVSNIDTLKAMAVEPYFVKRWERQLAGYISASFKSQNLSALAGESIGLVGKLVTVVTLWLGARLVIEGHLSVGQLIAFNMLAGRVSQPILRLAQLWTNFQQVGVSVQRLGDILNTRSEVVQANRSPLPVLEGNIDFEDVRFRYRAGGSDILSGVNLTILSGQFIGVVGESGSGKSTLARLVQRIYSPEQGRVLIDGTDLALVDVSALRRQIGVVLQDSVLFQRSVRENIALCEPGASFECIVSAAKLAGAHEFILGLPEGYDTVVGEQGASLSGGQRQRIAIARALVGNPRIVIFDEATSALDYESEYVVQENMREICKGRTVIVIAHRLSAVRKADRIVVMGGGRILEVGSHVELLRDERGQYAKLYRLQQGGH